jgi:hypothetical protein
MPYPSSEWLAAFVCDVMARLGRLEERLERLEVRLLEEQLARTPHDSDE